MTLAPIALFTYNRPSHTRRTIDALLENPLAAESEIFIFSDAPKRETDNERVAETRRVIDLVTGFKKKHLIIRQRNLGLASSIISGVTQIVNNSGKIIVIEDDLITAPSFLKYMNEALEYYANEERVISVHGYVYPLSGTVPNSFFLKGADCWGWGTWKRGWDLFEKNGALLYDQLQERKLINRFDFEGTFPYSRMLEDQIKSINDSWAIRWYASALLKDKLTLYPGESLVLNIGNDGEGTHGSKTDKCDVTLSKNEIKVGHTLIEENGAAYGAFVNYFKRSRRRDKIKGLLNLAVKIKSKFQF